MTDIMALRRRLPAGLQEKLAHPPKAGGGVHRWLFTMSLQLHRHLTGAQIEEVLAATVRGCGRVVEAREISDAVSASAKAAESPGRLVDQSRRAGREGVGAEAAKWPPVDTGARERAIAGLPITTGVLQAISPTSIAGGDPDARFFLAKLFAPGSLICVGRSGRVFATHPLDFLLRSNLSTTELVVPSPMTSIYGLTQGGKRSQHTLDNTGPRRYLVTEFDSGTPDEQASIIHHLGGFAPLVMVLTSGGRSLHAWWNCVGGCEARVLEFFCYAVSLGADPATWCRSQFVRLPQGWRSDKQAWQQVLFFDPAKLPAVTKGGAS